MRCVRGDSTGWCAAEGDGDWRRGQGRARGKERLGVEGSCAWAREGCWLGEKEREIVWCLGKGGSRESEGNDRLGRERGGMRGYLAKWGI